MRMKIKKKLEEIKKKPISSSIIVSLGVGVIACFIYGIINNIRLRMLGGSGNNVINVSFLSDISPGLILLSVFFIYPFILTLIHIVSLFLVPKDAGWRKIVKRFEYITIALGLLYTRLYMWFCNIKWDTEWYQQVEDTQLHQPIWTGGQFSFFFFCAIGFIGYVLLSSIKLEKIPPLIIVLSITGMYIGMIECVIWCIHIFSKEYCLLCLLPFNCIIIAMKTIRYKIKEWNTMEQHHHHDYEGHPVLNYFSRKLTNAVYWPIIAFVFLWTFMGIMICILALFGQVPQ